MNVHLAVLVVLIARALAMTKWCVWNLITSLMGPYKSIWASPIKILLGKSLFQNTQKLTFLEFQKKSRYLIWTIIWKIEEKKMMFETFENWWNKYWYFLKNQIFWGNFYQVHFCPPFWIFLVNRFVTQNTVGVIFYLHSILH